MMLPGQMRMHWPHRMHRARKRSSSRAPGGRMRLASRLRPGQPADAPHGGQDQPGPGHDKTAPGQVRQPDLTRRRGLAGKGDPAGGAAVQAVHAHDALANDDGSRRTAGPFAVFLTDAAIAALVRGLADAPGGKAAQQAEQRPQRADEPAEEPGQDQVQAHHPQEHDPDEPGRGVKARLVAEHAQAVIG